MTRDSETVIGLYERHAAAWVGARLSQTRFVEQGWLERFRGLVGDGGGVLDLGCGAGRPMAAALAAWGCQVTGVDSSEAMIALFREHLPDQAGFVADMRSLDLGRDFQGILAWDSFFHLAHDDQRGMFAVFAAHAASGAPLMFNTGPGHGESIGTYRGDPLYHASLGLEEYRELLSRHGFAIIESKVEDPAAGGRTVWLARRR